MSFRTNPETISPTNKMDTVLHGTNLFRKAEKITENYKQYRLQSKLLSDGIPAESRAAGSHPVENAEFTNMNYADHRRNEKQWPRISKNMFGDRKLVREWYHADVKNLAYFFIYPVYDELVK